MEIAAVALIDNEGESNFTFVLSEFKKLNQRDDYIFLVNKDFNSIECLKTFFRNVTILLCSFYVLEFMRVLVSTEFNHSFISKSQTQSDTIQGL